MKKKTLLAILLIIIVMITIFIGYLYSNNISFEKFSVSSILKFISEDKLSILEEQIQKEYDKNENVKFIIVDNLLYKVGRNGIEIFTKNGDLKRAINIITEDPVLSRVDKRIVIGDRKNTKVYIIEDARVINEIELPGYLFNIEFNEQGFGVLTGMDKKEISYAFVIDRQGNIIFQRFLTELYGMKGIISNDNKNVMLNCIDTTSLEGKTYIYFLDMDGQETGGISPTKSLIFPITNYIDNSTFYIAGQKEIVFYYEREIINEYKFEKIISATMVSENQLALAVEISENESKIIIFNKKGEYKELITINKPIKNIFSYSGIIGVNTGNEAIYYNLKGQEMGRIGSIYNIKEILFFNKLETAIITDENYILGKISKD